MIGLPGHVGELLGEPFLSWGSLVFGGVLDSAGAQILVVKHVPGLTMFANLQEPAYGLSTISRLASFSCDQQ